MSRSYDELTEAVEGFYEPEDFYDYDAYIEEIRNDYGVVVDSLDLEIEEDDPRFIVNSS